MINLTDEDIKTYLNLKGKIRDRCIEIFNETFREIGENGYSGEEITDIENYSVVIQGDRVILLRYFEKKNCIGWYYTDFDDCIVQYFDLKTLNTDEWKENFIKNFLKRKEQCENCEKREYERLKKKFD